MKKIITVIIAVFAMVTAMAQSQLSTVEYQKVNRQGVVAEMPFPEKTVRDAIDDKMGKMGYKGKEVKGFIVYRSVKLSELGGDVYDLYFMADRKSRRDKDNATLTLLVSKGFDSFVADSTDAKLMDNAKSYVNSLRDLIAAYDLELQIMAQEDAVKKAEKKYNNLIEDGQSLEKKRKNIEKDIEENKKDQENQKTETEKQRQILDTLRGKRKQ
jgi:hypothetical protein